MILDSFTSSTTTGIAANLFGRRFVGIDLEEEYLKLSVCRKKEIEILSKRENLLKKLQIK